eukprot:30729-Pelagococcus_subviridis.AAC.3
MTFFSRPSPLPSASPLSVSTLDPRDACSCAQTDAPPRSTPTFAFIAITLVSVAGVSVRVVCAPRAASARRHFRVVLVRRQRVRARGRARRL